MSVITTRSLRNVLNRQSSEITPELGDDLYVSLDTRSAYAVPEDAKTIRVISGSAWVSYRAADHVLVQGDEMTFDPKDAKTAVVTAVKRERAVIAVTLSERN